MLFQCGSSQVSYDVVIRCGCQFLSGVAVKCCLVRLLDVSFCQVLSGVVANVVVKCYLVWLLIVVWYCHVFSGFVDICCLVLLSDFMWCCC
jgi:hypothetical protein